MTFMRRPLLLSLFTLLLVLGLAALALVLLSPTVVSFAPEPEGHNAAGAPVQITFSRTMDASSVEARLVIEPDRPGTLTWQDSTLLFQPDEPWAAGTQVRVSLASGARARSFPGLPIFQSLEYTFVISEPQILYLHPAEGPADLYLLDPLSGQTERLTTIQGGVLGFSAAPDGQQVYLSVRSGAILVLDRASGEISELIACAQAACSDPQASPDGAYLAYVHTARNENGPLTYPQVIIHHLEDGSEQPADPSALSTTMPRWSSSGWLAFYDEIQQVYRLFDQESGRRVIFPNQTGGSGAWSPQGEYFIAPEIFLIPNAYVGSTGNLEPMPTSHLLRFDLSSETSLDLTEENTLEDTGPAIAPDGRRLAFARKYLDPARWTPGRQLWLMDIDGSQARPLTDQSFYNHTSFQWKPDGSQLLYVRTNQTDLVTPPEIWRMEADGSGAVRLVIGGFAPVWIP